MFELKTNIRRQLMNIVSVEQSIKIYMDYHKTNSRPNTVRSFGYTLAKFSEAFSTEDITKVSDVKVLNFLDSLTKGLAQSTKSGRAAHLSALFNFISDTFDLDFPNPCRKGSIKKLYRTPRYNPLKLIDKDTIDEIIYRAEGRDRIMLELMGRTAMRVGEVLNIKPEDLNQDVNFVTVTQPKSGRQGEVVFLNKKLMKKLASFIRDKNIQNTCKVFTLSYTTIFRTVRRLGNALGVKLRPHDLRRHAATQASRAGVPLEIISKVILRHKDLKTTQRYLGKVDDLEASRVIEALLG